MQHHVNSYETYMTDKVNCPILGVTFVLVKVDDKKRIYSKWAEAIIVKVYGKTVGYRLLYRKLNELWNPTYKLSN